MNSRQTDTVTRVDIRIPNHLGASDSINSDPKATRSVIAHFNAKIHHRSNKPELTPTILELIQIGIAHIESNLPVAYESIADELRKQIGELDARLKEVEGKLSGIKNRQ